MTTQEDATAGVLNTLAAYAQALDEGRVDHLVALFAEDAVVDIMGQGVMEGREAIRGGYLQTVPTGPQKHFVGNSHISEWGETAATVISDLAVLKRLEAGWAVLLTGRYQDTLRLVDGSWLFSRKALTLSA